MKILLADDHALVRSGVRALVKSIMFDAKIIEVQNCYELLTASKKNLDIDLILLDLIMPGGGGMQYIPQLRNMLPSASIVILSLKEDYDTIRHALDLGVKGFIPKSTSTEVMKHALDIISLGGIYIPNSLIEKKGELAARAKKSIIDSDFKLSPRQQDILELIGNGNSNKKIGSILGLREATIRAHLTAIFKILKVSNRTEAGYQGRKLGLIRDFI